MKIARVVAVGSIASALLVLSACSSINYDERMAYLRKTANRGADVHALIVSQEATVDQKRCEKAWDGLGERVPANEVAGPTNDWTVQVRQFFVDSCVSGKPKPIPGEASPTQTATPRP